MQLAAGQTSVAFPQNATTPEKAGQAGQAAVDTMGQEG
jgi:hypothetical protein